MISRLKIFILCLGCMLSSALMAAQEAVIRVDSAYVYADLNLEAPIGKLRRGTTVMVGEVKRRQGTVLPIAVSGRIAWIKVSDITLKSDQNFERFQEHFREHDTDVMFETTMDRLSKNNHLIFSYGLTTLGSEWTDFTEQTGSSVQSSSLGQFRLFFEHRPPQEKYNWGLGLNYMKTSSHEGQIQYQGVFLEALISRIFLNLHYLSLELTGGALLSGSTEIGINTADVFYVDKGPGWGYRAGVTAKILPYARYGIYGGLHYEWINTSTFDTIDTPIGPAEFEPLSGVSIIFGLSYKL